MEVVGSRGGPVMMKAGRKVSGALSGLADSAVVEEAGRRRRRTGRGVGKKKTQFTHPPVVSSLHVGCSVVIPGERSVVAWEVKLDGVAPAQRVTGLEEELSRKRVSKNAVRWSAPHRQWRLEPACARRSLGLGALTFSHLSLAPYSVCGNTSVTVK